MNNLAIVFPGQGSQYSGMGKSLYDKYEYAKKIFNISSEILNINIKEICFSGKDDLFKTEIAQPAIFIDSFIQYHWYLDIVGIDALYLSGHSLGEISALGCAEAMKFEDALKIVQLRGSVMQKTEDADNGRMLAIFGMLKEDIQEICFKVSTRQNRAEIANYNSYEQIVVSGDTEAINDIMKLLDESGCQYYQLPVKSAFHSYLMENAAIEFQKQLECFDFNNPKIPVLSSTSLELYTKDNLKSTLCSQIITPVKWTSVIEYFRSKSIKKIIELGPGMVLKKLNKQICNDIIMYSYDEDQHEIENIGKADTAMNECFQYLTRSLAIAVSTPNLNNDTATYSENMILPYREIKDIVMKLEQSPEKTTMDNVVLANKMLHMMFEEKKTPTEERLERFDQLYLETGIRL
jgi:[acyl-carrier-protein] S-malonyltransferase